MYAGRLIFKQVMELMPLPVFRRCVEKYKGDFNVKTFSCLDQFLCMAFAQLAYRESLRDTVLCLRAMHNKLHNVGIQCKVAKSTLADANEKRDWRIFLRAGRRGALIRATRNSSGQPSFSIAPIYLFSGTILYSNIPTSHSYDTVATVPY